jgi:hypothetical protein
MTLIFGDLTQNFVEFQTALNNKTPDFPAVAAAFRHASALNASYLAYIGTTLILFLV